MWASPLCFIFILIIVQMSLFSLLCVFFYGVVLIRSLHLLGTFIQRPYLSMFTVCVYLTPGLFFVYYLVFKQAYYFTKHWCDKWSIKYPVRGFELATTWLSVSSHNHQTRAHALSYIFVIFAQFQLLYVRQIHFGVFSGAPLKWLNAQVFILYLT